MVDGLIGVFYGIHTAETRAVAEESLVSRAHTKNKEYVLQKQREDKRKRKLWAIEYLGGKCSSCGETFHPAVYEFHHTDPSTKDRDPSKMLQLSLTRLTEELDKCVLLCANCHRIEHHGDKY